MYIVASLITLAGVKYNTLIKSYYRCTNLLYFKV